MDAMERLRRRLRELLDERTPGGKIRQKKLCQFLEGRGEKGKSEAWLSNILQGRRGIRLADLDGIAEFFNLPPGELIRHEGDELVEVTPMELAILRKFRRLDGEDLRAQLHLLGLGHWYQPPDPKSARRDPPRELQRKPDRRK
jgi:transcriptional regulator with XRE-family HTH domain